MKTIKLIFAIAFAVCMGGARAKTIGEAVVEGNGGKLAVNFCRPDVVHFRFAPKGADFASSDVAVRRQAVAKTDADYPPVEGEAKEESLFVEMASAALSVHIDRRTLGVGIRDTSGQLLLESGARPFTADGARRTASFRRDVASVERFFGLGSLPGEKFMRLDHGNSVYELWLDDNNVHAIMPLWYSTAGYGIYVNDPHRGRVSFTRDYSLTLDGGEMNFYFFRGPGFKRILANWSELAGRMNMPPLYALGLTWRSWGPSDDKAILACARKQVDAGIKMDVCGIEPGWHTRAYPCSFVWSPKFPDPRAFMKSLHDMGLKANFWEHPYLSPECPFAKAMEPYGRWGKDIAPGTPPGLHGCKYGFGGLIPDMSMPEARDIYWKHHLDNVVSLGADGFKIDETDQFGASDSLSVTFPSGIDCNAYHNLIGTLTCNFMHERYKRALGVRTFLYSRGNYAGMQRWATSAYTDFYGFPQFVMALIGQAYSGTYYTPEIRTVHTGSDIDYMRRAQMMFLTPFPQSNEWAGKSPTCVLDRKQEVVDCYKKFNALHYALIPYLYSLFWEQHNTGVGVVRPLPLEFPDDVRALDIADAFMLGPSLLVRPVPAEGTNRVAKTSVYLPIGADWIDYNTGKVYQGGQTIRYAASAETLPLFVRMGAIIPEGRYGSSTAHPLDSTVRLHVFPSAGESRFTLYEDDGISFAYEKGDYAETPVICRRASGCTRVTVGARRGARKVPPRLCEVIIHAAAAPSSVTLDGKAAARWRFEKGVRGFERALHVQFTDDGKSHDIVLVAPALMTHRP